jgi:SAM-dependent methyltransferase
MKLLDIFKKPITVGPLWDGQYKIPWDEPDFSRRMLAMHLSQDHDLASRRLEAIESQIDWIQGTLLDKEPSRVLDLACGPGLYSHRLAALGHTCHGLDFSPASIDYADQHNEFPDRCSFALGDLRTATFGDGFDAALMIYGEFNAFPRQEALAILKKAFKTLNPGGRLLIEAHTPEQIKRTGKTAASWYKEDSGLFSDKPHIVLMENNWHEAEHTSEAFFYVIDAASTDVTLYRNTLQGYSLDEYLMLLTEAGFSQAETLPAWTEEEIKPTDTFVLLTARK